MVQQENLDITERLNPRCKMTQTSCPSHVPSSFFSGYANAFPNSAICISSWAGPALGPCNRSDGWETTGEGGPTAAIYRSPHKRCSPVLRVRSKDAAAA